MYFLLYPDSFVLSFVNTLKFRKMQIFHSLHREYFILHKPHKRPPFCFKKDLFRSDRFITNHAMNLLCIASSKIKLTPK